jgi:parallel beta-helix repeat protein
MAEQTGDSVSRRRFIASGAAFVASAMLPQSVLMAFGRSPMNISLSIEQYNQDKGTIQSAIDTLSAAGGGTVTLLPGIYEIEQTIDLKSYVHLRGSGRATVLKLSQDFSIQGKIPSDDPRLQQINNGDGQVIKIRGRTEARVSRLRIDGNKAQVERVEVQVDDGTWWAGSHTQHGIFIFSADLKLVPEAWPPRFDGTTLMNSLEMNQASWNCAVTDCLIENCHRDGIHVLGSHNIRLEGCECRNNGGTLTTGFGIMLDIFSRDCTAEACRVYGNNHGGIEISAHAWAGHRIARCEIDTLIVQGSQMQTSYADPVTGVQTGLWLPHSAHLTIEDCLFDARRSIQALGANNYLSFVTEAADDIMIRRCQFVLRNANAAIVIGPSGTLGWIQHRERILIEGNVFKVVPEPDVSGQLPRPYEQFDPAAAIRLTSCSNVSIRDNRFTGPFREAVIALDRCSGVLIQGNELQHVPGVLVSDGQTIPTEYGLYLLASQSIKAVRNILTAFPTAVAFQDRPAAPEVPGLAHGEPVSVQGNYIPLSGSSLTPDANVVK